MGHIDAFFYNVKNHFMDIKSITGLMLQNYLSQFVIIKYTGVKYKAIDAIDYFI